MCTLCHMRHDTYIFKVPIFNLITSYKNSNFIVFRVKWRKIPVKPFWYSKFLVEWKNRICDSRPNTNGISIICSKHWIGRLLSPFTPRSFFGQKQPTQRPNVQSKHGDTTYSFRASRRAELSMGKNFISQWKNLPIIIISYRTNSTAQGGRGS